jgi:hypothetical protein
MEVSRSRAVIDVDAPAEPDELKVPSDYRFRGKWRVAELATSD